MKSFKGFNKDMTCRDFQYKEGKEYETDKAEVCNEGFHACEYPLDCFKYYPPASSVFHEVEQSGDLSKDNENTKVASTKIKIGAEIGIPGLVKAAIEYTKSHTNMEHTDPEQATAGNYGAATAGECGAATAGNAERQQPGIAERQQPGNAERQQPGNAERQQPGIAERQQPGIAERQPVEVIPHLVQMGYQLREVTTSESEAA